MDAGMAALSEDDQSVPSGFIVSPDQIVEPIAASPDESVEAIRRGLKRNLILSGGDEEQAKPFPRHASWTEDSHLYSNEGVQYTKINVKTCDEIFVPIWTKCFCRDNGWDYWLIAKPNGRKPPSHYAWR